MPDDMEMEEVVEETVFDELDEFDLESLILEGKNIEPIQEVIEVFDRGTKQYKKMKIYVIPVSQGDWASSTNAVSKKKNLSLEAIICAKGMVDKDGMPIELSKIKKMPKGVVTQTYEKIRIVSGQREDDWENKVIREMVKDF